MIDILAINWRHFILSLTNIVYLQLHHDDAGLYLKNVELWVKI
jgi:hypothetical protein